MMRNMAATPRPFERSVRVPSEIIAEGGSERGSADGRGLDGELYVSLMDPTAADAH
jgi:hypothetical protein